MKTIIIDLDGTLCNFEKRKKFVEQTPKDYKNFLKRIKEDSVNYWCSAIIRRFFYYDNYRIIIVTGREETEKIKKDTLEWLEKNDIVYDEIYFRKAGDRRKDYEIKKEIYEKHLKDKDILFVIEDRKRVVDMWRSLGLVCLHCAEGDY